jgi:hypothetical protein
VIYRLTAGLVERVRLAEEIFRLNEPVCQLWLNRSFSGLRFDLQKWMAEANIGPP